jgi:hypothetical protein
MPRDVEVKFRRLGDEKLLKALGNWFKEHFATGWGTQTK